MCIALRRQLRILPSSMVLSKSNSVVRSDVGVCNGKSARNLSTGTKNRLNRGAMAGAAMDEPTAVSAQISQIAADGNIDRAMDFSTGIRRIAPHKPPQLIEGQHISGSIETGLGSTKTQQKTRYANFNLSTIPSGSIAVTKPVLAFLATLSVDRPPTAVSAGLLRIAEGDLTVDGRQRSGRRFIAGHVLTIAAGETNVSRLNGGVMESSGGVGSARAVGVKRVVHVSSRTEMLRQAVGQFMVNRQEAYEML